MSSTILVFAPQSDGHYVEYVHHIYMQSCKHRENRYIFLADRSFCDNMKYMDWPSFDNVAFVFIELRPPSSLPKFLVSFYYISIINKKVSEWNVDKVFSISLMYFVPAGLFLNRRAKFSGVIYKIYLRDNCYKGRPKIVDYLKYLILSKSKVFRKILILNDSESVLDLNDYYNTDKFCYLPDPCLTLPSSDFYPRTYYKLGQDVKVFAHIGALSERKGTLTILDSLRFLTDEQRKKYVFIFSGKVDMDIKDRFYALVGDLSNHVRIIVENEYCSFSHLSGIVESCDVLLIPYKQTAQSSGIVGYSSQMLKPVVAPESGLVGKIVREYSLGVTCDCSDPMELSYSYQGALCYKPSRKYYDEHSVSAFVDVLFDGCI